MSLWHAGTLSGGSCVVVDSGIFCLLVFLNCIVVDSKGVTQLTLGKNSKRDITL